jgi:hypothetical protein
MDEHHIIPRSMGGGDQGWNKMKVCPECHRLIFVPGMSSGIHSVKHMGSIVVFGYVHTSDGQVLNYRMVESGLEFLWAQRKGENTLLSEPLHPEYEESAS